MAKELYLYSPIYDFVAETLISQMEESKDQDIVLRGNTPGGSVFSGWGIIAKMKEHAGDFLMKCDGVIASMGTFILLYAKRSQALDVSRFLLHRADMYVNTPEQQAFLDEVNKDLKAKMLKKLDKEKLKEIKGVTVDQIFDPETRIDVWLTAKEAKQIGLIDKIVKLDPDEIKAMSAMPMTEFGIAASANPDPQSKPKTMTLDELKAQHPALYNQIFAEGKTAGTTEERDRIRGWNAFRHIDAAAVDKGIADGKVIGPADMAEFQAKALSPENLAKLRGEAAKPVATGEAHTGTKTEKDKELEAFDKELEAEFKRNKMISA